MVRSSSYPRIHRLARPLLQLTPFGGGSIAADPPALVAPFILDTRAGGAQDITAAATLAAAEVITGMTHNNGPAPVFWCTNFENNPSGRCWGLPWTGGALNPMFVSKAGLDFGGILDIQYDTWFGGTPNLLAAGGIGAVGAYAVPNAHKFVVVFYRSQIGGASTNDNRHTFLHFTDTTPTVHGAEWIIDNYVVAGGQCAAGNTATVVHDNGGLVGIAANQFAGLTLEIWTGTGAVEQQTIASNTASPNVVFTLSAGLAVVPDATSKHRVLDLASGLTPPPSWGAGTYLQDNTAGNLSGGIPPALDLDPLKNQALTFRLRVHQESAPGAKDGAVETWVKSGAIWIKTLNIQSPVGRTGAPPLRWKEVQCGGPTWNNPSVSCTQAFWNLVISNPAA